MQGRLTQVGNQVAAAAHSLGGCTCSLPRWLHLLALEGLWGFLPLHTGAFTLLAAGTQALPSRKFLLLSHVQHCPLSLLECMVSTK